MQILSIHLKNIKSHRDSDLSFSPGINVLSGPNGVGKSTVFEAVGYALFGVDARDFVSNVERFLTIGAKKGEIAVTFQGDNGDVWRVTRTVGTPSKWLLAKGDGNSFEVEEHARLEETESRIAELLGLDSGRSLADQFKLVIGPFQNEFLGPFVIKQAIKRQEEFDKILGIDHWRKTYKGTTSLLSTVQEKIKLLAVEIDMLQKQTLVLPERAAELAFVISAIGARQADLKKAEDSLQQATQRLQLLDRQKEQVDAAESSFKEMTAKIESGGEHIAAQKVLVEESESAAKILKETTAGKEAYEKAETRLVELREKEKERRGIEQEVVALEREAARLAQSHEHEAREITKTGLQLAEEERSLSEVRKLLTSGDSLISAASRLTEVRKEVDRVKGERAVLDGRRVALLEGRAKLAEGVCPVFGEACPNVEGGEGVDVFSARSDELCGEMLQLDGVIARMTMEAGAAEKARQELDALKVRSEELDKQLTLLAEKISKNRDRNGNLKQLKVLKIKAAAKAAARKENLSGYAKLDEELARTEGERAGHQA
ncbi:MAG: SMC family ATPase, partial [Geobacter sp.]